MFRIPINKLFEKLFARVLVSARVRFPAGKYWMLFWRIEMTLVKSIHNLFPVCIDILVLCPMCIYSFIFLTVLLVFVYSF
jgi:hypothetical protein